MVTINEIAKLANVSRSTVSRVLNNSGYVSEEARKKVEKVIKDTDYVPSQYAKSLRTKETKVVGVILPRISTETSSRVVMGIDSVLSRFGYQILLTNTDLNPDKEIEYIKLLTARQVDGIILVATNISEKLVQEIQQLKVPLVAIGQDIPGVSSVTFDDYHAAKELTELFLTKGKHNIAFIGVPQSDQAVGYFRLKGFMDALEENNMQANEQWMRTGGFKIESGYEAMKSIMNESKFPPNGVFAVTDRLAIGAMKYLIEQRCQISEEIGVAGFGNSDISMYVTPSLTTVHYENEQSGRTGAELLLEKIAGDSKEVKKIVLNYRLMKRNSL